MLGLKLIHANKVAPGGAKAKAGAAMILLLLYRVIPASFPKRVRIVSYRVSSEQRILLLYYAYGLPTHNASVST